MRYLIGTMLVLCALSAPALAQTGGYAIPSDNPFVATAGARGEIYVYGLRNPFRWSFDRLTGDIWVGDAGGIEEEITHLPRADIAGANLGWNCYSGDRFQTGCQPPDHVPPSYTWPNGPDVSIGGYVIRAPDLPAFAGRYVFSKLVSGIHLLSAATTAEAESAGLNVFTVVSFGEDGVGHLYAISQATNAIYRLGENGSALTLSSIGTFDKPIAVAAAAGDSERLFIVEQPGKIKLRMNGRITDFLDLTSLTGQAHEEEGLLAVAIAPDYATSGRVFAFYADNAGDLQLDEYTRVAEGPDRSSSGTRKPLLTISHHQGDNHNGGQLLFGPDAYLYLSTGDGGGVKDGDPQGDGQSLASLLGKILRIDVHVAPGKSDTIPPGLRTSAQRRQRAQRIGGVVAYVRCNERCSVALGGRLRIGKREYAMRKLKKSGRANRRARVKVRLGSRGARALKKALEPPEKGKKGKQRAKREKVSIQLSMRATDRTGNRSGLAKRTVLVTR